MIGLSTKIWLGKVFPPSSGENYQLSIIFQVIHKINIFVELSVKWISHHVRCFILFLFQTFAIILQSTNVT